MEISSTCCALSKLPPSAVTRPVTHLHILADYSAALHVDRRSTQRVAQDVLAASTVSAEESFLSARVVRTFGTEQLEQDRYRNWLQ